MTFLQALCMTLAIIFALMLNVFYNFSDVVFNETHIWSRFRTLLLYNHRLWDEFFAHHLPDTLLRNFLQRVFIPSIDNTPTSWWDVFRMNHIAELALTNVISWTVGPIFIILSALGSQNDSTFSFYQLFCQIVSLFFGVGAIRSAEVFCCHFDLFFITLTLLCVFMASGKPKIRF